MVRLSIRLLGPLEVSLHGRPAAGLRSDKVRALLAYLAVEGQGPRRREKLAGLLWADWPEPAARASVRRALANLRDVIGDRRASTPLIQVTPQTIQFQASDDAWIDVRAFTQCLEAQRDLPQDLGQLEEALGLYRGDFLEGLSIADSPAFEEWALLQRERLRRLALEGLGRLVDRYEGRRDYPAALRHAWRQVELDPWREKAQRQLMRLLAFTGQRGAAVAQYESCRCHLAEELGVEPSRETTLLCEQIRDGTLALPSPAAPSTSATGSPGFLSAMQPTEVERPLFVARQGELARLDRLLDLALAGHGCVAFVTGEAGSGKTALLQEFARRAQDGHAGLLVAGGHGNAHTGVGDPYLPFREVLALLTGDVEAGWSAGAIGSDQARRLWDAMPITAQAMLQLGPDLIETLVPGRALLGRAAAFVQLPGSEGAEWLAQVQELVERKAGAGSAPSPSQRDLFQQYSQVLQALGRERPLLLLLDDLQWADHGSIGLLFHLGRQSARQRILIVGAYRPEDVALGRQGERHPLEPVVNEFRRDFGDIVVDLDRADGRDLVEALVDSEPNRLGPAFRDRLYRQTHGHALFTVELLRGQRARGDLTQGADGRWVEASALDWETLPGRVEGVIAERFGRLPEELRETLRVASVEGELFTAEVVARVLAADEGEVVRRLSGELSRQHRLVAAWSLQRLGPLRLSRYRFRHYLFQKYLYGTLDEIERRCQHEAIGNALEGLYGQRVAAGEAQRLGAQFPAVADGAAPLARHFEAAGVGDKAAEYRIHAGIRAYLLSAHEEAIAHFNHGLTLLKAEPDTPSRAEMELTLLSALIHALHALGDFREDRVAGLYARMQELCERMGEVPLLLLNGVWWLLHRYRLSRAEYEQALELGDRLLDLAPRVGDPLFIASAHLALGWALLPMGEFASARAHLEYLLEFNERQPQGAPWFIDWQNLQTALTYDSWALWCLGYPEQALKRCQEALALAQQLGDPFHPAYALSAGGAVLHLQRREPSAARGCLEAFIRQGAQKGFALYQAVGEFYLGRLEAEAGQVEPGIQRMRQGLASIEATGTVHTRSQLLLQLAEAHAEVGQGDTALGVLEEALALVARTGERYHEAELQRLKGELLRERGDEAGAEAAFDRAIEVARRQSAKSWELRAAMSLSRLWQAQGKGPQARDLLAPVYGWFTEGFDTTDLKEAKALLEALS